MNAAAYPDARILIVDDQLPNVQILERILRGAGYGCYRSLTDSRQALAAVGEFNPDLILLDLMMPHLDGIAVMEQLRGVSVGNYLPILVLTADVASESKRRALAAGAKDFVTKPIDVNEVLLRINNLLETRFLYKQLQRRADERIAEQAALLDRATDAILVCDTAGKIQYWNRGAERMYGWTAEEAVGRVRSELLKINQNDDLNAAQREVLAEGKWKGELVQESKDGRTLTVASRWTLERDEGGHPKALLIINTDITEKKRLELELIQAQRMEAVGVLAGGIAHDFNNILTIIVGYSELVLGGMSAGEPSHEMIEQVREAGLRAARLTRQLLAFSRKQVLSPIVLNLNKLVEETKKMLGRLIGEDLSLVTNLDPQLENVKADAGQMEQVLMNLVVNARDAMPTGGEIVIETANVEVDEGFAHGREGLHTGPYCILSVRDTGSGMDAATAARIFEPFFTTKELGKGTGLGLSTVYGIVKQSGGYIQVKSELGEGATFTILLPRAEKEAPSERDIAAEWHILPRGRGLILLVEDEEQVRALASMALQSAHYTVIEAKDGIDALDVYRNTGRPVDLLVTDVVMPRMSGRELADHLAAEQPGLRVLYMSGYTDDTIVRHGVLGTEVAFLQKPITPSVLARKVYEVLGH